MATTSAMPLMKQDNRFPTTTTRRTGSRERHYIIDGEEAEDLFADPETVLKDIDITPGRLLNRETGFRIAAIDPVSMFAKMGLRNGDLILAFGDELQHLAFPQRQFPGLSILTGTLRF